MSQTDYSEEQQEVLKEDRNLSVTFQIICQVEIIPQTLIIKDFNKINSIQMLTRKDQLKENVQQSLNNTCLGIFL
jgi:hypothetical protein